MNMMQSGMVGNNPQQGQAGNNPQQGQAGNINANQQRQEEARRRFGKIPNRPVPVPGQMNGNQVWPQRPAGAPPAPIAAPQPVQPPAPPVQAAGAAMPPNPNGQVIPGAFGQASQGALQRQMQAMQSGQMNGNMQAMQAQQAALQRQLQQQQMAGR